jgi:N-acetylmuramoyl-L-alanine amidase
MKNFEKLAKLIWLLSMAVLLLVMFLFFQTPYNTVRVEEAPIVEIVIDKKELSCIRQALWHEARGEGEEGIKAVLSVIVNRVNSPRYPSSFCKVIHQHKQFSYVHELEAKGKPLEPRVTASNASVYTQISELAKEAVRGDFKPILPESVLWYHTHRVNPVWSRAKIMVAEIGNHRFFSKKQQNELE